jgi:hypothetical protein
VQCAGRAGVLGEALDDAGDGCFGPRGLVLLPCCRGGGVVDVSEPVDLGEREFWAGFPGVRAGVPLAGAAVAELAQECCEAGGEVGLMFG